jgi:DNA-directed RNA polymerase specialized sigma24 family protein
VGLEQRVQDGPIEVRRMLAARLIERDRSQLEAQIHAMLMPQARRLVDTEEIISTALRRVDEAILEERIDVQNERQFFGYVNGVLRVTMLEKARRGGTLTSRERIAARLRDQLTDGSGEVISLLPEDLIEVGNRIPDSIDREIVLLRGRNFSFKQIAEQTGLSPEAARKRWQTVRERLKQTYLQEHEGEGHEPVS